MKERVKLFILTLAIITAVYFAGVAVAVPAGKTVEFAGGDQGKVVFDGKIHSNAGNKCKDCHPTIFPMKGPGKDGAATITMAEIEKGKYCGTCHNGEKSFKVNDPSGCTKCHKK